MYAWIVTADNIAVVRQIQVGSTTGDLTIISSGLNEGDRVVLPALRTPGTTGTGGNLIRGGGFGGGGVVRGGG